MSLLHVNPGVAAQSDGEPEILSYEENVIIPEETSSLDEFGRPPFFRLSFERTAGVGPEDLPTPFTAYVESGTITYRNSLGETTELVAGTSVAVGSGDEYSLRNMDILNRATLLVLPLPGSCLVYADYACMPHFLPYEQLCTDRCRPDITNTLLFEHQDARNRLLFARFSATRLLIPAKKIVESLDSGGESELIRLYVRVEVGSIVTINGETYAAGDEFVALSDDAIVVGESGAELIVLRVAASIESG